MFLTVRCDVSQLRLVKLMEFNFLIKKRDVILNNQVSFRAEIMQFQKNCVTSYIKFKSNVLLAQICILEISVTVCDTVMARKSAGSQKSAWPERAPGGNLPY